MKVVKISLMVLGGLFIIGSILRVPAVREQDRTEEVIAEIQAQRITMEDVMGENLPPAPDPEENNATIAGIDANGNDIRDDVELAIHERYPDNPALRAAMLQYALGLQHELTNVTNSETWVAAVEETSRANICIVRQGPEISGELTQEKANEVSAITDAWEEEVESMVHNTDARITRAEEISKFIDSFGRNTDRPACDIDPEEFNET